MSEPTAGMVRAAARWHVLLGAEDARADVAARCRRWQAAHAGHAEAFRRIAAIAGRFEGLPAVAHQVLSDERPAARGPRRLLPRGGVVAALLLACGLATGLPDWPWLLADHHTQTGEIRQVLLPDGSEVTLDTASAIDLDYTPEVRRIRLLRGRILLQVARDPARPLMVDTPQGRLRALGTRFSVRVAGPATEVAVEESAVETCAGPAACVTLLPSRRARLQNRQVLGPEPAPPQEGAWAEGLLVARDRPLAEVLDILAAYRPGLLRFDRAAVAPLRVSGVLPLRDTDRALAALAAALPLRVTYRTAFWVTVAPD